MFTIAIDKKLHLVAGFLIAAAVVALSFLAAMPTVQRLLLGVGVATVVGVGKEVYDGKHPATHTRDGRDALATIIGGVVGAIAAVFLIPLFNT